MIDLKKIREEKGLTQEQLAECCFVTRKMISHIECGRHLPSVETAKEIGAALGFNWIRFFEND